MKLGKRNNRPDYTPSSHCVNKKVGLSRESVGVGPAAATVALRLAFSSDLGSPRIYGGQLTGPANG